MSDFWLRCDACNQRLKKTADVDMQLTIRFKPSRFPWQLPRTDPNEHRERCESCGWVNVFVPAAEADVLQGSWRDSIVTK